jgi:hypothetical protein
MVDMRTVFPGRQVMPRPAFGGDDEHLQGAVVADLASDTLGAALGVETSRLFAFQHGKDTQPRPLSDDEIGQLGDVFTQHVLLTSNEIPVTLGDLIQAIEGPFGPQLPVRKMFLVDEGAMPHQLNSDFVTNQRLVFTWQASTGMAPDILVSTVPTVHDPRALLQLIAWSEKDQAFHFFERDRERIAWGWAGNSFNALSAPTRGRGPFDSHINGGLVMKELKPPWTHWSSQDNTIPLELYGASSEFNTEPIFQQVTGAEQLQPLVEGGIRRWTGGRLKRDLSNGQLTRLPEYFRQLLWCTSVNLVSSPDAYDDDSVRQFRLPSTFFFDADAIEDLAGAIKPQAQVIPPRLTVDADLYRNAVGKLGIHVTDVDAAHRVDGDTHFAFLVPERAFEDQAILAALCRNEVISPRLALCLLLVDFSNPVFSPQRAQLLSYAPESAAAGAAGADLDARFVAAVQAKQAAAGSPEAQFLQLWNTPDIVNWAAQQLGAYQSAIQAKLQTPQGVEDILRLAESRRHVADHRKLLEFLPTLARDHAPPHLAMAPDGAVFTKTSDEGEDEK